MSVSKRVFFGIVCFCALIVLPAQAESITTLYDIDFSSPLHTVGQPPATGPFEPVCRTVQDYNSAYVTDSFGEMTNQPCVLYRDPLTWYPCITLIMNGDPSLDRYARIKIEVDLLIESLKGDNDYVGISFGQGLAFNANGIVTNGTSEAAFNFGHSIHLEIDIDLELKQYKAVIGEHLFTGPFIYAFDEFDIRLCDNGGNKAAIDNLKIYGVGDEPELTITCPQAGNGFTVGKTYPIRWYSSSEVKDVSIEYSIDAGATWAPFSPQNTGNTGVYNWTVPNTPSDFCKLRLSDSVTGLQAESGPFRLCEPVAPLPAYEVIDLEEIFGMPINEGRHFSLNDNGALILPAYFPAMRHSVWMNGEFSSFEDCVVFDVNNKNQVLLMPIEDGGYTFHIWQNGNIIETVTLNNPPFMSWMNDQGSVLLHHLNDSAALWRNGIFIDLPSDMQIDLNSNALNNSDQVVGTRRSSGAIQFVVWSDDNIQFLDLPSAPWYADTFVTINNNGTVAGSLEDRTFVWKDNQRIELEPGRLVAFNDHEQYLTELPGLKLFPKRIYLNHGGEQVNLKEAAGLPATYELHEVEMNNHGWIMAIAYDNFYSEEPTDYTLLLVPKRNRTLESLTIVGPELIRAGSIVPLRAVGACDDNCPVGLTELVTWNVHPSQAGFVAEGFFHAGDLVGVDEIIVTAEYTAEKTLRTFHSLKPQAPRKLLVPSEYPTIQAAVDVSQNYDTILLADGIYTGEGNRDISFGGKRITVISQSGPAYCVIDCQGSETDPHRGFVFENGETPEAVLSGVSIVNGYAPVFSYQTEDGLMISNRCGGGILIVNASPTTSDCIFAQCSAGEGGGIFCRQGTALVRHCVFRNNNAGGAAICSHHSMLTLEGCLFSDNDSTWTVNHAHSFYYTVTLWGGGAIFAFEGSSVISNCIFSGNSGTQSGAITAFNMQMVITNCTFAGNRGNGRASLAALVYDIPEPVICKMIQIDNCIFDGNRVSGSPEVIDGTGWCFQGDSYLPMMRGKYSAFDTLSADLPGIGNIQADPLFVRDGYWDDGGTPEDEADDVWVEGDYHLRSEGWSWDVPGGQWTWGEATSPCIDAGHPAIGLGDEPLTLAVDPLNRFGRNIRINMGAYGGTAEASMAPEGWALLNDLDNSGRVTQEDFVLLAENWLSAADALPADTTRDGLVDWADLMLMADQWLQTARRMQN